MTLPARPLLLGFLLVLAVILGLQVFQLSAPLDRHLLDQEFRVLRSIHPQPLKDDVLVIGIDEKTYLGLKEPYAL